MESESLKGETKEKVRAMATDTEAHMLSLYKLAALKARKAVDTDQIAKIWAGPLSVYEVSLDLISLLIDRGNRNPDLIHLREAIRKVRDQVRWNHDLHAGQ